MLKRKSPVKTEGKDRSKITKQEPSRQFMKLSAKPPLPKPEPEFKRGKKKICKERPGTKGNILYTCGCCLVTKLCPHFATPRIVAGQAPLSMGMFQAIILE